MSKPSRQTITYLTRRFEEVGLNPVKRLGQNFLIDANLVELLARSAKLGPDDVVLEVGTGTGALTTIMAPLVASIITVEIDEHLAQIAAEELEEHTNVRQIHQDVLKSKNRIHPNILAAIDEELARHPGCQFKLAANLPYNIATPLISNLLLVERVPDTMTVTIQKELADRILASPGSKDYGALSVWVQSLCDVELVRVLAPSVFWPRPKVHSAIIHIEYNPAKRGIFPDLPAFHEFARSIFFHRRKFLRSVAVSAYKDRLTKPEVDTVLRAQGLGVEARTEQLTVEELQALFFEFQSALDAKEA